MDQITPWLVSLTMESSFVNTVCHHLLIRFCCHSCVHSADIQRVSCHAPCCVLGVPSQRGCVLVPMESLSQLGRQCSKQELGVGSVPSSDPCFRWILFLLIVLRMQLINPIQRLLGCMVQAPSRSTLIGCHCIRL